jgi:hypothetical protein
MTTDATKPFNNDLGVFRMAKPMKLHIPSMPESTPITRELLDQRLSPAPVASDSIVPDYRHNGWYLVTWAPNMARKLTPISPEDAARQLEHTGPAQLVVFGYLTALQAPRPHQPLDFAGQEENGDVPPVVAAESSDKLLGMVLLLVLGVIFIGAVVYLAITKTPPPH